MNVCFSQDFKRSQNVSCCSAVWYLDVDARLDLKGEDMSWWDSTDAFDREACMGKHRAGTGGMQSHQSYLWSERSYLLYWLTTLWRLANIPLRMWKAADMFQRQLSLFSQNWYEEGGKNVHRSQIPLCSKIQENEIFYTLWKRFFAFLWVSRTEKSQWTATTFNGTGFVAV